MQIHASAVKSITATCLRALAHIKPYYPVNCIISNYRVCKTIARSATDRHQEASSSRVAQTRVYSMKGLIHATTASRSSIPGLLFHLNAIFLRRSPLLLILLRLLLLLHSRWSVHRKCAPANNHHPPSQCTPFIMCMPQHYHNVSLAGN